MQPEKFKYKKVIVLSDNYQIAEGFVNVVKQLSLPCELFSFFTNNDDFFIDEIKFVHISLNEYVDFIISNYDLLFSAHCKQIIPLNIVNSVKCINLHPGFNPYNRGWFPHVFSIINGLPAGASLHEMDEKIDNGPLIAQKEVAVSQWDTSLSLYEKVKEAEFEILKENLVKILSGIYETYKLEAGNINSMKQYNNICRIDPDENVTYKQAIDKLRALSHGNYKNAWFVDNVSGKKIYVKIELTPDE